MNRAVKLLVTAAAVVGASLGNAAVAHADPVAPTAGLTVESWVQPPFWSSGVLPASVLQRSRA
jgi:hypothetical protein